MGGRTGKSLDLYFWVFKMWYIHVGRGGHFWWGVGGQIMLGIFGHYLSYLKYILLYIYIYKYSYISK